jgi:hypothetical protein
VDRAGGQADFTDVTSLGPDFSNRNTRMSVYRSGGLMNTATVLADRTQSWLAQAGLPSWPRPVDRRLQEKVRSLLADYVRHPQAIEVTARQGRVTLSGPVLRDERPPLLSAVAALPEVAQLDSQLQACDASEGPQREGFVRPQGYQAVAAMTGVGLLGLAFTRRGLSRTLLALAGLALLLRSQPHQRISLHS